MTDPYPELAPFAVDTWPTCEPWERAGLVTPADRRAIDAWADRAMRQLRLDIDARFDSLAGWAVTSAWPGVSLTGNRPQEGEQMTDQPETDAQRIEREERERQARERSGDGIDESAAPEADDDDDDDDGGAPA